MTTEPTELKPCPFCGKKARFIESWKDGNYFYCKECYKNFNFSKENWNSAWCWKEIDRLKAELAGALETASLDYEGIKAENLRIREFIEHKNVCNLKCKGWGFAKVCTCGLEDALKESEQY